MKLALLAILALFAVLLGLTSAQDPPCTPKSRNTCGDGETCRVQAQAYCQARSKCGVCTSSCKISCTSANGFPECNDFAEKPICKKCRFTACLREGLRMAGVQARRMPVEEGGTSLTDILHAWRWTFLPRRATLLDSTGRQQRAITTSNSQRTGASVVGSLLAEGKIFVDFLRAIKMHEKLNLVDLTDLARSLLICWAGFENVRQNVVHMAFRSNVMYFADE
ncbi:hypothetical protein AAVH_25489, partial [Aphelenchoides avenae]